MPPLVFIMLDGVRPDALTTAVCPTLSSLRERGFTPMTRPLPGIVEVARAAGKRVAFFYNWEGRRIDEIFQ